MTLFYLCNNKNPKNDSLKIPMFEYFYIGKNIKFKFLGSYKLYAVQQ